MTRQRRTDILHADGNAFAVVSDTYVGHNGHPGAQQVGLLAGVPRMGEMTVAQWDPVHTDDWEALDALVNALIAQRTAAFVENDARWGQVDVGDRDPTSHDMDGATADAVAAGRGCPHVWTEQAAGRNPVEHRCTRRHHLDKNHIRGDGSIVVARTPARSRSIFEQFGLDPATGFPPRPENPPAPTLRDVDPTAHGGRP